MYEEYTYILKAIEKVSELRIFKLFPKAKKIEFKAGQFVKISKVDKSIGRAYSIASPPSWNHLEFLIKMVGGEFTSYLEGIEIGTELIISKPAGHMIYKGEKEAVLIGAGAGISPMIGIAREIMMKEIEGDFTLFYSARTLREMPYYSELRTMSKRIRFVPILTREKIKGIENEHISIDLIKRYVDKIKNKNYYICGNLKMTLKLKKELLEEGIKKENIKTEGWG